jgi:hypothetical protein
MRNYIEIQILPVRKLCQQLLTQSRLTDLARASQYHHLLLKIMADTIV